MERPHRQHWRNFHSKKSRKKSSYSANSAPYHRIQIRKIAFNRGRNPTRLVVKRKIRFLLHGDQTRHETIFPGLGPKRQKQSDSQTIQTSIRHRKFPRLRQRIRRHLQTVLLSRTSLHQIRRFHQRYKHIPIKLPQRTLEERTLPKHRRKKKAQRPERHNRRNQKHRQSQQTQSRRVLQRLRPLKEGKSHPQQIQRSHLRTKNRPGRKLLENFVRRLPLRRRLK